MTRIKLPTRRVQETISFRHGNTNWRGSVGYVDDRPVELFLEGGKNGSALQAMTRDCAVAASFALQAGVTLEDLSKSLTRLEDGMPAGPLSALIDLASK